MGERLEIDLALVAEGSVEAWPVKPSGGGQIVERGAGIASFPKGFHDLLKRLLRIVGAGASAPLGSFFLYHFANNSLTPLPAA